MSCFRSGVPVKPMKTALGMSAFIVSVQLAALRAVALVHEDEQLAHGRAGLGFQFLDEGVEVVHALPPELVDQRAEQARLGLAELRSSGRARCWCGRSPRPRR